MYQRSAADIAAMFPNIDEHMITGTESQSLATTIADGLIAAGIDKTVMGMKIAAADPAVIWTGMARVLETMLATVPAGCGDAVAVHMVAGFARHLILEVLIKDFVHIVEECTEMDHLNPVTNARMGGAATAPTIEQWHAIITEIRTALDAKMAAWVPATATIHMEDFIDAIMTDIDVDSLKDKTIAELFAAIATKATTYIALFTGTATTCDVGGMFDDVVNHIEDLKAFFTADVPAMFAAADLPDGARPIVIKRMTDTMGMVATELTGIISTQYSDMNGFIRGILREATNEVFMMVRLCTMVNGMVTPEFIAFVDQNIADGHTDNLVKTILRTVALTMADIDIGEKEIQVLMTTIIKIITGEAIPAQERWFSIGGGFQVSGW